MIWSFLGHSFALFVLGKLAFGLVEKKTEEPVQLSSEQVREWMLTFVAILAVDVVCLPLQEWLGVAEFFGAMLVVFAVMNPPAASKMVISAMPFVREQLSQMRDMIRVLLQSVATLNKKAD